MAGGWIAEDAEKTSTSRPPRWCGIPPARQGGQALVGHVSGRFRPVGAGAPPLPCGRRAELIAVGKEKLEGSWCLAGSRCMWVLAWGAAPNRIASGSSEGTKAQRAVQSHRRRVVLRDGEDEGAQAFGARVRQHGLHSALPTPWPVTSGATIHAHDGALCRFWRGSRVPGRRCHKADALEGPTRRVQRRLQRAWATCSGAASPRHGWR